MIEKTAWDVRKYPEKFAVYRILCNFAVVFQNCINSMEAKYIHRELSAVIEEAYRYFSVITVTGPRQSGKTTLLRNLFSYLPYYSLENLDVRSFAENDPVAFLNQHTEGMILDEVHNAPNLLSYIQGMVDNDADRRFAVCHAEKGYTVFGRTYRRFRVAPPVILRNTGADHRYAS